MAGTRLFYKGNLMPLNLIHFITNKCNTKCKHCFYWKNLNTNEDILTVEEIDKMTKNIGNILFVSLTGGEPFLRKDIVDIAKVYYKNTKPMNITIPTNGILTDKIVSDVNKIIESCPKSRISIRFSIDGTEELHDNIRGGKGVFKAMMKTYTALDNLKKKWNNLDICFVTVISKINQKNLENLFNFMKQNLNDNTWFVLLARGNVRNCELKDVDIETYKTFVDKVRKTFRNNAKLSFANVLDAKEKLSDEIIYRTITEDKYLIPCYAGRTICVINENGVVKPCEILDDTFGNIRDFDYDFRKLWKSGEAKELRKRIIRDKCYCSHECFITNNILFNLRMWTRIIKKLMG